MRILHVVGTRPNLVKMAPVIAAVRERFPDWPASIVHTGQHYDRLMSEIFLEELGVPEPDHLLGVGSGSHAEQIARVLERLEPVLRAERPDLVIVPGDVNSTLGAALCAAKLGIAVAHLESGLRSFDRTMPEETNRIVRRPDRLPVLPALRRGDREPARRGGGGVPDEVRRQHDDRHPGGAQGPDPRAPRGRDPRPRARELPAGHAAQARPRRRAAARRRRCGGSRRWAASCRSCSRSTRAPARCSTADSYPGVTADRSGRLPRLPLTRGSRPAPSSPTPAGSRRRRPTSGSRASRFATTPSGR